MQTWTAGVAATVAAIVGWAPGAALASDGFPDVESLEELRTLERRVQETADVAIPATVHITVPRTGSQGSGVIVDPRGLVLTAAHVTGRSNRACYLTLHDGTRLRGRSLGVDHDFDCGMILIDRDEDDPPLAHLEVGDERELDSGDWCIALGHPGGWIDDRDPVVRLGRMLPTSRWMGPFLRTDCAIMSGDSGGPLLDLQGRVIGIHSRIQERVSANYHVHATTYLRQWDEMTDVPSPPPVVTHSVARLGVRGEDAGPGVLLTEVNEGTGAARAGLAVGDIIQSMDGEAVKDWGDLVSQIRARKPGDTVLLDVRRNGRERQVQALLGARR